MNKRSKSTPDQPRRENRSRRVRPYALTAGRTRTRHQLLVETMISAKGYDAQRAAQLLPESRAVYEQARSPVSLAEVSACLNLPMGVIRVLVSDMTTDGLLLIHPTGHTYRYDYSILERILDGLNELSA